MKNLLLLSNSTTHGFSYLEHALDSIKDFFGDDHKLIAFIPYAGVTFSHDDYEAKVASVFNSLGYSINSVHNGNPRAIIEQSDAIAVGGGNTFQLLKSVYEYELLDLIRTKVENGTQYIGWSAGSNLACPTIRTTNDMPIVEPRSFQALDLIEYQINPHYLDAHPEGHHGETREQRIEEYLVLNQDKYVIGLREGSTIHVSGDKHILLGSKQARIFKFAKKAYEIEPGTDLSTIFI